MTPTQIAKWVTEALEHGEIGQSEMARRLTETLKRPIDRAAVQKMTIIRETGKKKRRTVRADELLAIAEITGYPAPIDEVVNERVLAPLLSDVSAGRLADAPLSEFDDAPKIEASNLDPNGDWIALEVDGTSMDRISPPESVIFVNRKEKQLVPNACYVIADEEGRATYKRYRPDPDRFEPVTFTPGHETIFPEPGVATLIVGRVRRTLLNM